MHGMGDAALSKGMISLGEQITAQIAGNPKVYIIQIGSSEKEDRLASLQDSLLRQTEEICSQLKELSFLSGGYNAIGFSQGGLILRSVAQRCLDAPPMASLLTFGSPHTGIADLPGCKLAQAEWAKHPFLVEHFSRVADQMSRLHRLMKVKKPAGVAVGEKSNNFKLGEQLGDEQCGYFQKLIKSKIYTSWAQNTMVQAQYYRDPKRVDEYLKNNSFLTEMNAEIEGKSCPKSLSELKQFVMFMFENDEVLQPKESSFFKQWNGESLQDYTDLPVYDGIGLRTLKSSGNIYRITIPSASHMQLPSDLVSTYLAPWLI